MKLQLIYEEGDVLTLENRIDRIKTIKQSLALSLKQAKDLMDGNTVSLPERELANNLRSATMLLEQYVDECERYATVPTFVIQDVIKKLEYSR